MTGKKDDHSPTATGPDAHLMSAARRISLIGVCAALLAWFPAADVWDQDFATPGPYLLYNVARLAYAASLAVALLGSGRFALNRAAAGWRAVLQTPVERLLLCFYAGAGIAIPLFYAVDAAGLLYRWLAIPLFLAAVWLGYPALAEACECARGTARKCRNDFSWPRTLAPAALGVALTGIWVFILLNSTLAVTGHDFDSASHYLPYYQEVVANHGTRPNEYWYHFWVSKGAGLHFLSVLLTDLEAPQLVSSVFLAFAALAMYAAVRDASRSVAWGLAAAAVLSAGFIGHFPYFQKDHIVSMGLVAGLLWATTSESLAREPRLRRMTVTVIAIAAVVNAPPLAAVLVGFLALLSISEWRRLPRRSGAAAAAALAPTLAAGATILGILCLNYLWTGLAEVTPFKLFLAFADQRRLAHYFSPYLLLWADEGSRGSTGELSLAALASRQYILHRLHGLLQLEALAPMILSLLAMSVPALLVALLWKPWRDAACERFFPAMLLLAFAVALGFVVNQPGSLERFYTFAFFPVILVGIGSVAAFVGVLRSRVQAGPRRALDAASLILALAIGCGSALYWTARWVKDEGFPLLRERAAFVAGRRTLEQAMLYAHWPRSGGGLPQRGVSEECVGLANTLGHPGPGGAPRVWTMAFLYEPGCYILPDVRLQLEFSVAFGKRWDRIVFGPPDAARAELRKIGVRYFYINLADFDIHRLGTQSSFVFGCLAYSPLFDPAMLSRRFRIVWRRNKALLLTFADGRGEPISDALVSAWRKKVFAVQGSLGNMPGMCSRLAHYYKTQGERWPVHTDPSLGKLRGWQ